MNAPLPPPEVGGDVRTWIYRVVPGNKLQKNWPEVKLKFRTENVIKCLGVKLKMQTHLKNILHLPMKYWKLQEFYHHLNMDGDEVNNNNIW